MTGWITTSTMSGRGDRARAVIVELGSETTVHGLSKIVASSGRPFRRIAWICFVIAGMVTAVLHLSTMVVKFLEYPMLEVSAVRQDMQVPFPSVTVCNIAAVSGKEQAARMGRKDEYAVFTQSLYRHVQGYEGVNEDQVKWLRSPHGGYENYPEYMKSNARTYGQFILHCTFNKQLCSEANFTAHFDGAHYYSCFTFNSGSDHEDGSGLVAQRTGAEYGLSLILGLDNDISVKYTSYNILANAEGGAGVRVVIHEQNTAPFPAEKGFDIEPGHMTSVSLKASLRTLLPKPHGNCSHSTKNTAKNDDLQTDHNLHSTLFSCLQLCQQKVIIAECGCKTAALPEPTSAKDLPYCGVLKGWYEAYDDGYTLYDEAYMEMKRLSNSSYNDSDPRDRADKLKYIHDSILDMGITLDVNVAFQDISCVDGVREKLSKNISYEKDCDCQTPCSGVEYKTSTSSSYWPLELYQYRVVQELGRADRQPGYYGDIRQELLNSFLNDAFEQLGLGLGANTNRTWEEEEKLQYAAKLVRQNILRLNIYMEDLTIMEMKQVEAYEITDLAADIGGCLGLWMGISVLSCLELVELVMCLAGMLFRREKRGRNVTDGILGQEMTGPHVVK